MPPPAFSEMSQPDFTMLRAGIDGFHPEEERKDGTSLPEIRNREAFVNYLFFDNDEMDFNGIQNWSQLLEATYQRIGFFRKYYCGEDLPEDIFCGGYPSTPPDLP